MVLLNKLGMRGEIEEKKSGRGIGNFLKRGAFYLRQKGAENKTEMFSQ
jgi:hypothetical protein